MPAIRTALSIVLTAVLLWPAIGRAQEFGLAIGPIALNDKDRQLDRVGDLVWQGGLSLNAEHPQFGGISALAADADGRLIAVTDLGWRFVFTPVFDDDGMLSDIVGPEFARLTDKAGAPLSGKKNTDAESLARQPDGTLLLSFERRHRIAPLDGLAVGTPVDAPPTLAEAPSNSGLEAITALADGSLLMLSEDFGREDGTVVGWRGRPGAWQEIAYPVSGGFKPTGAATLPNGDVLVVERYFSTLTGVACRIRRVKARTARSASRIDGEVVATLRPPLAVDNLEAIAVIERNGDSVVLLMSDDNLNRGVQRNLLLAFRIDS